MKNDLKGNLKRIEVFEVIGRLPGLNEYINACRYNRYTGAMMKKYTEDTITSQLTKVEQFKKKVNINFTWYEPNKKRDNDNVSFAKKFIIDGLVQVGILKNDTKKYVGNFTDTFIESDVYKVVIEVMEE